MGKGTLKIRKRITDADENKVEQEEVEQKKDGVRYVNIEVTVDDGLLRALLKSTTVRTNFLNKFKDIKEAIINSVVDSTPLENNMISIDENKYHDTILVGIRELRSSGYNPITTGIVGAQKGDVNRDRYVNHKPVDDDEDYDIHNQDNVRNFLIYNANDKFMSIVNESHRSDEDLERVMIEVNKYLPVDENDKESKYDYPTTFNISETNDGKHHLEVDASKLDAESTDKAFKVCEQLILNAANKWAENIIKSVNRTIIKEKEEKEKAQNQDDQKESVQLDEAQKEEKDEIIDMVEYVKKMFNNKDDFKNSVMNTLMKNAGVRAAYEFMTKYVPIKLDTGHWIIGLSPELAYDCIFNMFKKYNRIKTIADTAYNLIDEDDKIKRSLMRKKESTGEYETAIMHNLQRLKEDFQNINFGDDLIKSVNDIIGNVKNFTDKHSDIMNFMTSTGKTDVFENEIFKEDDVFGLDIDIYNSIIKVIPSWIKKLETRLIEKKENLIDVKESKDISDILGIQKYCLFAEDLLKLVSNLFEYYEIIKYRKRKNINVELNKCSQLANLLINGRMSFTYYNLNKTIDLCKSITGSTKEVENKTSVDNSKVEKDTNDATPEDFSPENEPAEQIESVLSEDANVDDLEEEIEKTNTEENVDTDGDVDESNA